MMHVATTGCLVLNEAASNSPITPTVILSLLVMRDRAPLLGYLVKIQGLQPSTEPADASISSMMPDESKGAATSTDLISTRIASSLDQHLHSRLGVGVAPARS
jgi:hypothetical protein